MDMKGKLLAFVLGMCLVLAACQGRMPPPSESSEAPAAAVSSSESPASAPAPAPPPESAGESSRPESAAPSSQPETSSSEAPPESSSEAPAPSGSSQPPESTPDRAESSSQPEQPPRGPEPPESLPDEGPREPEKPQEPGEPGSSEDPAPKPEQPDKPELPEDCRWQSITEASLLTLINKERGRQRQTPLTYDPDLARAARLRAEELFLGNYVAHTRPDGSPWETVLQEDVPTEYAYAAENLAWSNHAPGEDLGAFQWFSLWRESKSHLAAMVGEHYTHCGIAVLTGPYYEGEAQSYAVAVFCSY